MDPFPGKMHLRVSRPFLLAVAALAIFSYCPCLGAEELYYRIQMSAWRLLPPATQHFNALKTTLAKDDCHFLSLEKVNRAKSPYRYGVYIGRFREKGAALDFLKRCQAVVPKAFLFRSHLKPGDLVLECSRDQGKADLATSGDAGPKGAPADPGTGADKTEMTLRTGTALDRGETAIPKTGPLGRQSAPDDPGAPEKTNLALVTGTLLESAPVSPDLLGFDTGKTLYRVVVFVDNSKEIQGQPNYLREKEKQNVTFFTADPPPLSLSGKKIQARAHYRGNRYGMHFWIEDVKESK